MLERTMDAEQLSLLPTSTGERVTEEPVVSVGLSGRLFGAGVHTVDRRLVVGFVGAVLLLIIVIGLWPERREVPVVDRTVPPGFQGALGEVAPDSLGVPLAELTDRWNELEQPPLIVGGLLRSPETGRFDGFRYRFTNGSVIAGAYDPSDDHLYALLVSTATSSGGDTALIVHLCHLLLPFSPECLDGYFETGLDGRLPAQYVETGRDVTWQVGDLRWRLTIDGEVETVRVFSPGAG